MNTEDIDPKMEPWGIPLTISCAELQELLIRNFYFPMDQVASVDLLILSYLN